MELCEWCLRGGCEQHGNGMDEWEHGLRMQARENVKKQAELSLLDKQVKHFCDLFDKSTDPEFKKLIWKEIGRMNKRYCVLASELARA